MICGRIPFSLPFRNSEPIHVRKGLSLLKIGIDAEQTYLGPYPSSLPGLEFLPEVLPGHAVRTVTEPADGITVHFNPEITFTLSYAGLLHQCRGVIASLKTSLVHPDPESVFFP